MVSGAIVVAALAAGSAGATNAKLLSFTTISHGSSQPTVSAERNFGKAFVDVISRVTDTGGWTNFVPKADATKIEGVKYQTHFVIGVLVPERTTGYSVTIKRITLQRISPSRRQFCIVARVDGPLSVRAAFSTQEVRALAEQAGMVSAQVCRRWPWRFLLTWKR